MTIAKLSNSWTKKDIEAIVNADTISLDHDQLMVLRKVQLEQAFEADIKKAVKKINELNKAYEKKSGKFILPYAPNRDAIMFEEMKNFCLKEYKYA